jgi:hypothetical protein
MIKAFCVFIISHGRANNVVTFKTLQKSGFTGPLFIVIDNEDKQAHLYLEKFGRERVVVFDKIKYAAKVDSCDNFENRRTTTHARNACFDIAAAKGFEYFLVLDDDYTGFYVISPKSKNTTDIKTKKFDTICEEFCRFLDVDERIDSICFMQTGDTVGGMQNFTKWQNKFPFRNRKAMNSFFCKTSRRFWFLSRLNEDVNTYLALGGRGRIFMTIPQVLLSQKRTQGNAGGMATAYQDSGTYIKTFYTVMIGPSFCEATVTPAMQRIHHSISWNNAVPKILDDTHKKK